ncbi:thiopurine S-methyltransferase [Wenzhouxiangella sp. XN79A]|uniref:thiopurine S-methyltransferase n=1 Tax=Wenzhouxiangella sp. XN79A TaxID=2724193 RepID=UPI00144AEE69|nr:thiopurine S-methyltransferase [Wenzhouxiangella sp. XN79A]NKI34496.1 thiopurine S-methyltransferase [Wenzhouxiangella sp. XN79A]
MDHEFWHERWARNEIGFHRHRVHPMLERYWPALAPSASEPVLVPLCGKSLDLDWLADRGHPVVGVELSEAAVRAFFDERGHTPQPARYGGLDALRSGPITLCIGDFLAFDPGERFPLIFDRAAMIALPGERRPAYRAHLAERLASDGRGLLITLEYVPSAMEGPPFSVELDELALDPDLEYRSLAAVDALPDHPGFAQRGLQALTERASRFAHRRVPRG